jgi:very-short-patch-repair endonuclease
VHPGLSTGMRNKVRGADAAVAEIAARQHGVVHISQLIAAGLTKQGITRRVAAGRLHRIHRGVYAVGHQGLSSRGRWKAATLALGPTAVLSHTSAAELWGMLRERHGYPHVTLPGTGDRPRRRKIVTHRSATLTRADVTICDGIPVTNPSRTLGDLPRTVEAKLVRAARRQAEFDRLPLGADHRTDRTRSELEREFLRLCRRHRLPPPEVNANVGPFTVDFLWRQELLIVEIDGYGAHSGRQAFRDDRVRDARLAVDGFRVQRFSDWQLEHEPGAVIKTVRSLL